jgi:hypothetical protein
MEWREVLEAMFPNAVTRMGGDVEPRLDYWHILAAITNRKADFRPSANEWARTTSHGGFGTSVDFARDPIREGTLRGRTSAKAGGAWPPEIDCTYDSGATAILRLVA